MPGYLVYDFVKQSVFAGEILTPNASFVVYMEGARANEGGCASRPWRMREQTMENAQADNGGCASRQWRMREQTMEAARADNGGCASRQWSLHAPTLEAASADDGGCADNSAECCCRVLL